MIPDYQLHAANERTFLAWVRTAIAVVGFGLGAGRLGDAASQPWTEAALLLTGAVVVVLAFLRMRLLRRRIMDPDAEPEEGLAADGLLMLLVLALLATLGAFGLHLS